ncbi:MAG: LacI family DNA-binding transcriptional regulator [Sediminicola sp.]|tara:strand:- start:47104 stop:48135 length:1032 start_codon:yes stop_codon:yes gene_type:complete
MKNKRYSIKDIASALNVSITTVSFVLNGKAQEKRISEPVTQKILEYAKKINFTPNQLARGLRTGKSKIIVFMVEDISNNYFFSRIARIIEDLANEEGYKVIFCSNDNDDQKSIEAINLFTNGQIDGYIIIPSAGIKETLEGMIAQNTPLVLFDRYFKDLNSNYVIIDNEEAVYKGVSHLVENRYRDIGFVTVDLKQSQMKDRLRGYEKAVSDYGLKPYILQLPYTERFSEKGNKILIDFIEENQGMDAMFFSTNYLTIKGLGIFKENYPSLIKKMGLVSFDDTELFKIYSPSITAIAQPLEEIAYALMEIIMDQLKKTKKNTTTQKVILKTKIHKRESTMPKS